MKQTDINYDKLSLKFLNELKEFIKFPSVSGDKKNRNDVRNCSKWLADHLLKIGFSIANIFETPGHPIVYASSKIQKDKITLLIYGHYDVQHADPVSLWRHDPFGGEIEGNYIYGRGSSDDKGQIFIHLKAIDYLLNTYGNLPVNIKCIFEGGRNWQY